METDKTLVPIGRSGTPGEPAGAVLDLASHRLSGCVTGPVLKVDGGQLSP